VAEKLTTAPPSDDSIDAVRRSVVRRHPLIPVLLLVGLFYLGNYNGLWTSNDGSHFALVKYIVERGSFGLGSSHLRYTLGIDFALSPDGRVYSDRPPGTALLLTPFYALGVVLFDTFGHGTDDPEFWLRFCGAMGVLFFALLNVALVYRAGRLMNASSECAALGSLIFATAGLAFKYSTLMFSHTPGVTTALAGVCLLLGPLPQHRMQRLTLLWLAGFIMGYAVLIEYQNILFSAVFFAGWVYRLRKEGNLRGLGGIIAGGAIPAAGLALYHWAIFGTVLTSTHAFNPMMPHNQHVSSIFSGGFFSGLYSIFLQPKMGVALVAPVILLGIAGLVIAAKQQRLAWTPLLAALLYTLLIANHKTIIGGATNDCRYFFPAASLLALGLAPLMQRLVEIGNRPRRRLLIAAFSAVAIYSICASFYLTVDQKMALEKKVSLPKELLVKYATVTNPDHNIERLVRNFVLPRYGRLDADYIIVPHDSQI